MYKNNLLTYSHESMEFTAYVAYPITSNTKSPLVIVVHDWSGRNDFADQKADELAALGYVGVAVDLYGKGRVGNTVDEKMGLMQPLIQDRQLLLNRLLAAYEAARALEGIDTEKMGAIGFCFGGLCVLDLARDGLALKGVVSFHGLLNPPTENFTKEIKANILVLHGYKDPMVTPEQVQFFQEEMCAKKANWEMIVYGNAMHAFTNPHAQDSALGTFYDSQVAQCAWTRMQFFFEELFR